MGKVYEETIGKKPERSKAIEHASVLVAVGYQLAQSVACGDQSSAKRLADKYMAEFKSATEDAISDARDRAAADLFSDWRNKHGVR